MEAFRDTIHLIIRWVVHLGTLDYKLAFEDSVSSEEDSSKTSISHLFTEIVGAFLQVCGWEDCRVCLLIPKDCT